MKLPGDRPMHSTNSRPRVRIQDRQDEEAEALFAAWADWAQFKLSAQGFGGGVDSDLVRTLRAPGEHADPVLSEFVAAELDDQGEPAMVHRILLGYTRLWRQVAWARWVGVPVVTAIREEKGTRIRVTEEPLNDRGVGKRVVHKLVRCTEKVPAAVGWSGMQTMERIAIQLSTPPLEPVSLRTVERVIDQLRRQIILDVRAEKHSRQQMLARTVLNVGG